jgi:hypothetical protein
VTTFAANPAMPAMKTGYRMACFSMGSSKQEIVSGEIGQICSFAMRKIRSRKYTI